LHNNCENESGINAGRTANWLNSALDVADFAGAVIRGTELSAGGLHDWDVGCEPWKTVRNYEEQEKEIPYMVLKSETQSLWEGQPSAVVPSPPKTVYEVADSRSSKEWDVTLEMMLERKDGATGAPEMSVERLPAAKIYIPD
jgi:hypothetical protein